jgi:hypothetical protein
MIQPHSQEQNMYNVGEQLQKIVDGIDDVFNLPFDEKQPDEVMIQKAILITKLVEIRHIINKILQSVEPAPPLPENNSNPKKEDIIKAERVKS